MFGESIITMKKIILSVLFLFVSNFTFSQAYKWRASHFSSRHNSQYYEWTKWTDWQESTVLIVAKDKRVVVHSATEQVFDIIEEVTKTYDNDNNPIYSVICVDKEGIKCKMIWYHTANDGSFVIFCYSNLELMYKVESLN
jgi:hypothetical protein